VPVDDYAEQPASVLIDPHIGELSEQETLAAIAEVRRSYNVDPNRTYLMGNSMGGVGTLYLAAKYPQMWAAISPSGGVIAAWSYPYTRLRDAGVSALFVHGEFDEHANPHWSEAMAAAAKAQGVDAQMLVVPHGSHGGAWIMALPQIFDFFDAHRRAQSGPPAPMAGVQPTNTGTAPDGTRWSLAKPAAWNGTLLIYSRGGAPAQSQGQPIQLAPRDSAPLLLAHGYALAGTAYRSHGWNPEANALGQFAALPAIESALGAKPKRVVNLGTSYGGVVGAMEVDQTKGNIDGSVLTCGLVVGGIDAMNAQLDGAHAINQLLTDKHDITLVRLGDGAGVKASADALGAAIAQARETPAGRARLALVSALMHMSTWKSGPKPAADDLDAQAAQQVDWLVKGMGPGGGLFGFMQGSRLDIETEAGGNPSWTRGVDYAALLKGNEYAGVVEALYRKAGLDLAADLAVLSRTADIAADPAAVAWMRRTSVPSGRLPVPVLAMQTSGDPVAPHAYLVAYAGRVDRAGSADQLRTAMVDRPGHCSFKPEEILATVQAMDARLEAGRWSAGATSPAALQAAAGPAAAFVPPPTAPFAVHAL
jgi:pimeloyl-ACP methyl ester carboxylesterase